MNNASLKSRAKELLKNNYGYCLVATLIMNAATFLSGGFNFTANISTENISLENITDFSQFGYFLENIITNPFVIIGALTGGLFAFAFGLAISAFVTNQLRVGSYRFFLKNRKNYPSDVKTIFACYTDKTFLNVAKVTVARDIIVALGYCLFYIPGIIWQFQYFAVDYILAVRPDIDRIEAFRISKAMMNGNKSKLFGLYFSFIGWYILAVFTCGILGFFYVTPYVTLTLTEFYAAVREDAIQKGVITAFDVPDYDEYVSPAQQAFNQGYEQPENNGYSVPAEEAPVVEVPMEAAPVVDEISIEEPPFEEVPVEETPIEEEPEIPEEATQATDE